MKVVVAESSGFCFGVQRAVSICEKAALEYKDCVTLGPIIHNGRVVAELAEKGVRPVYDISDVLPGNTVIIRSHGAGKKEYDHLAELGANVIDATCPDVKRIHNIVREEISDGRLPVIIGERRHPEVASISGCCDQCEIFETPGELAHWIGSGDNARKPIALVFQTTNTKTVYHACADIAKKECTNCKIFDTICGATCKRQQEAEQLSKSSDVMIIVGGENSANSLRLADICKLHCSRVIFIKDAKELETADIRASDTVGIIAGASTPACIIKEVTQKMSEEIMLGDIYEEKETEDPKDESVLGDDPEDITHSPDTEPAGPAAAEVPEETAAPEDELPGEQADSAPAEEVSQEPAAPDESGASDEDAIASENAAFRFNEPAEPDVPEERAPISDGSAEPYVSEDHVVMTGEAAEADIPDNYNTQPDETADPDSALGVSESFEEMLEKSIKTLHTGQKVTGIVTSITATEVSVDLGTKQSGYVPIAEFIDDANTNIDDVIKIGDSIETFVMRVNDVEGMVMLSKKRLDAIKNWDVIESAKESRAIVEGIVTEENKGGIVVNIKGVRVFVPASQTGLPKSSPMSELLKKTVKLRVTEVNQSRRRVVGSIRAVQADERREKSDRLWNEIEVGKQYTGVVKSMTSYGVFVDIGGVDGMIHISELSWTRVKVPSEVMSVGDDVTVYVLSFDKETRKISLGYKKNEDNPWTKFTSNNSVGDVVNVKIVKLMPFGAFAEITPGVDGLIHISQITDHRIGLPSEVLTDGQFVDVKITEIDNDRKKVSLSIRALIDPSSQKVTDAEAAMAAEADNTPVIVYDTDAPPPAENEDDEEPSPEPDDPEPVPGPVEEVNPSEDSEFSGAAAETE